jgi:hypothetical protein
MEKREERRGGGSGGGDAPNRAASAGGKYLIQANQVELLARPPDPPLLPATSVISILATSDLPGDGQVEVRGAQGVRITTGLLGVPPASSDSTNGVEIVVSDLQNVTIQRGDLPDVCQKIEMTPEGITIDAGVGTLTIKSLTQITLSVAEGLSTITLGPEGITIKGLPLVQIN